MNKIKNILFKLAIILYLVKPCSNTCLNSDSLFEEERNYTYNTGPNHEFNFNTTHISSNQFSIIFWANFITPPASEIGNKFTMLAIHGSNSIGNTLAKVSAVYNSGVESKYEVALESNTSTIFTNVFNKWGFIAITFSNTNNCFLYSKLNNSNNFIYQTSQVNRTQVWDNFLKIRFGTYDYENNNPNRYFNGKISLARIIYKQISLSEFNEQLDGQPILHYYLDFGEGKNSQFFVNKISNSYNYASSINGYTDHSDVGDFNYNNGWEIRWCNQFIQLPNLNFNPAIPTNYIVHIKTKAYLINSWSYNITQYSIFERVNSSGTSLHKIYYENTNTNSLYLKYKISGDSSRRNLSGRLTCSANSFCTSQDLIFSIIKNDSNINYTVKYSLNGSNITTTTNNGGFIVNSTDKIYLGKKIANEINASFPNIPFHNITNCYRIPQFSIVFESFSYYLGSLIKYFNTGSTGCKANSSIELGNTNSSFVGYCKPTYIALIERNDCIKVLTTPNNLCIHDMQPYNACYKCDRFYGNNNNLPCERCHDFCEICSGSSLSQCIYCKPGYGKSSIGCSLCSSTETWDAFTNRCQHVKNKYMDLNTDQNSAANIKVFFKILNIYSNTNSFIQNIFNKYWIKNMNRNYYIERNYTNLFEHRKVTIQIEFFFQDTSINDRIYLVIDNNYKSQHIIFRNDFTYNSGNVNYWGNSFLDYFKIFNYVLMHSSSTMNLKIIPFYNNNDSNLWVRDIKVGFFGCFSNCSNCTVDNSPIHCTSCKDGYFLLNNSCNICGNTCKTCINSANNCTQCNGNLKINNSICVTSCGLEKFDLNGVCQNCGTNCIQCSNATTCIVCRNGFYSNSGTCQACNSVCINCSGTSTSCTSCPTNKLLKNNSCIDPSNCNSNYFVSGSSCLLCPNGCTTCNISQCLTCQGGFKKKGNLCTNNCGDRYYDLSATHCASCRSECLTCTGSDSNCGSCISGYYLVGNSCRVCVSPCSSCSSDTICLSCVNNFYLLNNTCVTINNCGVGKFGFNNQCLDCNSSCKTCELEPTKCTSCNTGFFLNNSRCSNNCAINFKNINGVCCPINCSGCSDERTCTSCENGFFLNNSSCNACGSKCKTCENNADKCLSCKDNLYLEQQNNICINDCKVDYFKSEAEKKCLKCHSSCKTCNGVTNLNCITCYDKFILYNGFCNDCSIGPFELINGNCWDRCGDGKRFSINKLQSLYGYNSCDDGNKVNGDGCNSDCRVEKNYRCTGGNEKEKDVCKEVISPKLTINKVNELNYKINFSEPVKFDLKNKNYKDIIKVSIQNLLKEDFTYELIGLKPTNVIEFSIKLKLNKSVKNKILKITVQKNKVSDEVGNSIKNPNLYSNINYIIPLKSDYENTLKNFGITNEVLFYFTSIFSYAIGNHISQNLIRSLLQIEYVNNIAYFDLKLNTDSQFILSNFYDVKYKKVNSPFSNFNTISNNRSLQQVTRYSNIKLIAKNFTYLDFSFNIYLFLIIIFINILLNFIFNEITPNDGKFKKILVLIFNRLLFIFYFFVIFEVVINCSFILINFKFINIGDIFNFISSIILILGFLLIPFFIYKLTNQSIEIIWNPIFFYKYGFLFSEFKLHNYFCKNFMSIMILRYTLLSLIIGLLNNHIFIQSITIFFLNINYITIFIINRPFIHIAMNITNILMEFSMIWINIIVIIISIDYKINYDTKSIALLSRIFIYLVLFFIFFVLINIIAIIILWIINYIKIIYSKKKFKNIKDQLRYYGEDSIEEIHENQLEEEEKQEEEEKIQKVNKERDSKILNNFSFKEFGTNNKILSDYFNSKNDNTFNFRENQFKSINKFTPIKENPKSKFLNENNQESNKEIFLSSKNLNKDEFK